MFREPRQDRFALLRVKWVRLGSMRPRPIKPRERPGASLAFRVAP
jgi:hypothetical protein